LVIKRSEMNNMALASLSKSLFISMVGYAVTTFSLLWSWIFYLPGWICAAAVNIARREDKSLALKFSLKDAGLVFAGELGLMFIVYLIAMKEII